MFWKRWKRGQRGQSAVETAIVMPMNVFIILAIIQNGLIAQARVMTKYAAYRAVRVGAMNNARVDMMTSAALVTLLPVLAFPSGATGPAIFPNMQDTTSAGTELAEAGILNMALSSSFLRPVKVAICGPVTSDLSTVLQSNFTPNGGSPGDSDEVDFDDPRASTEWTNSLTGAADPTNFAAFMQTKLRIQVQFNYPMVIPFANWIISLAYLGQDLPDVMRMETSSNEASSAPPPAMASLTTLQFVELLGAEKRGVYLAPINVSYAMRMQSNIYLSKAPIPGSNLCFHYKPS